MKQKCPKARKLYNVQKLKIVQVTLMMVAFFAIEINVSFLRRPGSNSTKHFTFTIAQQHTIS